MKFTAENLLNLIKLCKKAKRYDDMNEYVIKLLRLKVCLADYGRDNISVAFDSFVNKERSEWRALQSLQARKIEKGEDDTVVKALKDKVKVNLFDKCGYVIDFIKNLLIKFEYNIYESAILHTIVGDNYRYMAETSQGLYRKDYLNL